MPTKSIFRQPGAKHFQLVHRSQRDPLINNPDASAHVLKPIERSNTKKGISRADLESVLTLTSDHKNLGESSLYGIYYDDAEYDYMQHLRSVGGQDDGAESILIESPLLPRQMKKKKASNKGLGDLELPDSALASKSEMPRNFESEQAIPDSIAGFQPDMDPHLRQVLEALDDDGFVDDDLGDNFFSELVADGERRSDEEVDFEFTGENGADFDGVVDGWELNYSNFKVAFGKSAGSDTECDDDDMIHDLPDLPQRRRRRKGSSVASGYSMSSSSMYRNEALQTLDECFNQIMLKEYQDDTDEVCEDEEQLEEVPELITTRSDFDSMVNEFLNNHEIPDQKQKSNLERESGPDKLGILRRSMAQEDGDSAEEVEDTFLRESEDEKANWDCDTILTTHTNFDNHPRLIRARNTNPVPRFQVDSKTGIPSIVPVVRLEATRARANESVQTTETVKKSLTSVNSPSKALPRPRNESKEDKKIRKGVVKQEKQARRTERKIVKQQFGVELAEQQRRQINRAQNMITTII